MNTPGAPITKTELMHLWFIRNKSDVGSRRCQMSSTPPDRTATRHPGFVPYGKLGRNDAAKQDLVNFVVRQDMKNKVRISFQHMPAYEGDEGLDLSSCKQPVDLLND
ncbi:hypothetical protein NCS56_00892600 [Fusarium sp. Ph1]|nr:hypothetical protein NCS56_00892600 [Fusarium sp. Ph1]